MTLFREAISWNQELCGKTTTESGGYGSGGDAMWFGNLGRGAQKHDGWWHITGHTRTETYPGEKVNYFYNFYYKDSATMLLKEGHQYYWKMYRKGVNADRVGCSYCWNGLVPLFGSNKIYTDYKFSVDVTLTSASYLRFQIHDTDTTFDAYVYPMLFDLTQMFGAGNEPTEEECHQIFSLPWYIYNILDFSFID